MSPRAEKVLANAKTDFERSDASVAAIGALALAIFVFLLVASLAVTAIYSRGGTDVSRALAVKPPAPALQTAPATDLAKFRAAEEARLHSYFWVDRAHGIAHIPIEQAMRELARRGIPDFGKQPR
jgi:hypothetical protein